MIKKLLLCVLTLVVITAKAQFPGPYVVPNTDWIKYYSQTDVAGSSPGAIDANGNVYTTGYSGLSTASNLIVLKYDSLGTQQYAYSYNNGSFDNGTAIKIDGSGNAYIAGISTGTGGTGRDYIIIKLSSSGVSQWVKRYDRGVNNIDEATAICVDINGNVYVTGKSRNSNGNYDIVTLKLSGSNGSIIWSHIYNGASGLDDTGTGIVLSANGNYVYVTGNTINSTTGSNIVAYALSASSGSFFWSPVITNGTANGNDLSKGIILVGSNIVICGETNNTTTGVDYTTTKYNGSTGAIIWQRQYDYLNSTNRATALVKDSAGNVGVVGTVLNGSVYEYHTVLYNSAGIQYAVNKESTDLTSLNTDPKICNDTIAHHWYISGEKQMSTKDIFVYQITPGGNTSWKQTIDGQNLNTDLATSIAVNGVGVVYVGAQSKNSSANYDYTTIKLNQTPVYWPPDFNNDPVNLKHLYLKNYGQLLRTDTTPAKEVLYYTHNTTPEVFIEQNAFDFVYKRNHVDTNGVVPDTIERIKCKFLNCNPLAAQHEFLPRSTVYNFFLGYASSPAITDLQGNERIFIPNIYGYTDLHYFSDKQGLKYYMVLKPYATNEIMIHIDGSQSATIDGTTGNLKIVGALGSLELKRPVAYSTTTLGAITTPAGSASWVSIGGNKFMISLPAYNINMPLVIMVSTAASVIGFGPKANLDYATFYGSMGNEGFNDIKAAANGDRHVTGWTDSQYFPHTNSMFIYAGQTDAVALKYTAEDTLRVASFIGGSRDDVGNSIEVNAANEVFVGGNTWSSNFPPKIVVGASNQTVNGVGTVADYEDGFLAKFLPSVTPNNKPSLSHNWGRYFGGPGNDEINSICLDGSGNLYFVGEAHSSTIAALVSPAQSSNANTNNSSDVILGKFDTNLSMVFGTFLGGGNSPFNAASRDIGMDITVDNNGRVIVCGRTDALNFGQLNSTGNTNTFHHGALNGSWDGFITRYSSTGTKQFSSFFGGSGLDAITRLAHDPLTDDIFFAGDSYDTIAFPFLYKANALNSRYKTYRTAFIGQMGGDLTKKWCSFYGRGTNTAAFTSSVSGLCIDGYGVLYVSGMTTSDTIQRPLLQPTTVVYKDSIKNSTEGFVAIFNPNQSLYHAHYFGGTNSDQIKGADISQNQKLYVVGNTGSGDFPIAYNAGNATLIDSIYNGGEDGFISRFDLNHYQVTEIEESNFDKTHLNVYPNPTTSGFNLELQSELISKTNLKVFSLMGQLIYEQDVKDKNTSVNCESWPNGVYLISVSDAQIQRTFKLIKN